MTLDRTLVNIPFKSAICIKPLRILIFCSIKFNDQIYIVAISELHVVNYIKPNPSEILFDVLENFELKLKFGNFSQLWKQNNHARK